ncbi:MAG: hypothetical protein NW200_13640 [Hyphomonadaceae bacterium]|nr:hypothetical protein [Hyphomonadaceae bacterium]
MWLVWTIAWTIFSANPLAAYTAERAVVRSLGEQADIDARLAASKRAVDLLGRAPTR